MPALRACRQDLERALELARRSPEALDRAAALLEDEAALELGPDATPELAAAWARLQVLPLPAGQHPFLPEILPAVEALRLLLAALSSVRSSRDPS